MFKPVHHLKTKFDAVKIKEVEVYPLIWDEGDDAFEYVANGFKSLQDVFCKGGEK